MKKNLLLVLLTLGLLVGLAPAAHALTGCGGNGVDVNSLTRRSLVGSSGVRANFDVANYYVHTSNVDWATLRSVYMLHLNASSQIDGLVEFGVQQISTNGTKAIFWAMNKLGDPNQTRDFLGYLDGPGADNGAYNFRLFYSVSSGGWRMQMAELSTQVVTTFSKVLDSNFTFGYGATSSEAHDECDSLSVNWRSAQGLLGNTWTNWAASFQSSDTSTHWDSYVGSPSQWQAVCALGQTCIS